MVIKNQRDNQKLIKRKASGVFVIIMILFYGAMIVSLFNVDAGQIMAVNNIDLHMGILLLIGFQAIMLFATLMQSKKLYLQVRMHSIFYRSFY